MDQPNYDIDAKEVAEIIDVAINSLKENPPELFDRSHLEQFVKTYLDYRDKALNPEPRFRNVKSLNQIKSDVLTYFQEGQGAAVNRFWLDVIGKKLSIKRVNPLEKVIKRGRIKDQLEYDMVIDLFNALVQAKSISSENVVKIDALIANYESGNS